MLLVNEELNGSYIVMWARCCFQFWKYLNFVDLSTPSLNANLFDLFFNKWNNKTKTKMSLS